MPTPSKVLDRVLVLEMVRVTEAAAIGASTLIGRGDEKAADAAAVEKMREALNTLDIDGTEQLALTKAIEIHPIRRNIQHADLLVVRRGEKVTVEVTVVVEGAEPREASLEDAVATVLDLVAGGVRLKDACGQVAQASGLSKKTLYDAALAAR